MGNLAAHPAAARVHGAQDRDVIATAPIATDRVVEGPPAPPGLWGGSFRLSAIRHAGGDPIRGGSTGTAEAVELSTHEPGDFPIRGTFEGRHEVLHGDMSVIAVLCVVPDRQGAGLAASAREGVTRPTPGRSFWHGQGNGRHILRHCPSRFDGEDFRGRMKIASSTLQGSATSARDDPDRFVGR